jgi:hypothetical protein
VEIASACGEAFFMQAPPRAGEFGYKGVLWLKFPSGEQRLKDRDGKGANDERKGKGYAPVE